MQFLSNAPVHAGAFFMGQSMWAILLALATLPAPDPLVDRVDLVEINHVYDAQANPTLVQAIFYDWTNGRHRVRASRLLDVDINDGYKIRAGHYPERDQRTGDWVMIFHDGALFREVRANHLRETWTVYDVERAARVDRQGHFWPGLLFERTR